MLGRTTWTKYLQRKRIVTTFLSLIVVTNLLTGAEAAFESWVDKGGGGEGSVRKNEWEAGEINNDAGLYLNAFAIKLREEEGRDVAEKIALDHGFRLKFELPHSKIFILERPDVSGRSKRSAETHLSSLLGDSRIAHAQQEVLLHRPKRRIVYDKQLELPIRAIPDSSMYKRVQPEPSLTQRDNLYGEGSRENPKFRDPLFKDMWYLVNKGQSGGERGLDMNVGVVWENGITGKGVVVCILDDGIDHTHADLKDNYDPDASTDLNDLYDFSDDPMPDTSDRDNSHGTRCAGEIAAAANNDVCGVGIAYEARIGGVRVLDGPVSDSLEAEAISFNRDYIDIYSASWGPSDDGSTMEGPRHLALGALMDGVRKGRKGLGSIFVWATGNGGMFGDDCSADGYVSRPETLSVGSVNDWGRSPFFMENCSSTLAVVPSGGEDYRGQEQEEGEVKLKVVTTDMSGGCIENFQGTSSAAPLAAGCVANVLQANPSLTWRDVQHIVVQGSRIPSADVSWTINGAGRHVSHRFGFGLLDCGRMVELAQAWNPVPDQRVCNTTRRSYRPLKFKGWVSESIMTDGCVNSDSSEHSEANAIDRLEHVQVFIKMSSAMRGETAIFLVSPAGTRSVLLSPRPLDEHSGDWEFIFMTVHNWDESPRGKWTLEVHHVPQKRPSSESDSESESTESRDNYKDRDDATEDVIGYVKEWSLALYGTHGTRHDRTGLARDRKQSAYRPSSEDVADIKKREVELARGVKVKRAQQPQGEAAGSGSLADDERLQEKKSNRDAEREELTEALWELLHAHGGRNVRKRVLQDRSNKVAEEHTQSRSDKLDELKRLAEELVAELDKRDYKW
ncbi:hypothetical protein EGW08_019088 [Elysia chlorotica]|uniref:P/Homo B domain-containing protein n=1 Tax=Elysia chlorotica TaxID=188477 RepID=A0A433SV64_ELYCH|nr:hypothetical protein EGW08_019088 [Elysia chlorotica]